MMIQECRQNLDDFFSADFSSFDLWAYFGDWVYFGLSSSPLSMSIFVVRAGFKNMIIRSK